MIIFPAIDIKDGNCVRLHKGDFGTVEKVAENPLVTARSFEAAGAEYIHTVDLDGAKEGKLCNAPIYLDIAKNTGLKVEVGGGIRDRAAIEYYLQNGVYRVILGSAAVKNPALVKEAIDAYGSEHIVVGIDAKNEMVATEGWLDTSKVHYIELSKQMEQMGVTTIIYTDISKDGTLSGPNFEQLDASNRAVSCDIVASGGIHVIEDIKRLCELDIYGAICGKSIYKGTLSLEEAVGYSKTVVYRKGENK